MATIKRLASLALLAASSLVAQTSSSLVQGTVLDASGAPIPAVAVKATLGQITSAKDPRIMQAALKLLF